MKIQHLVSSMAICLFALLVCSKGASAQTAISSPSIDEYFTKVTTPSVTPDSQGFIRRWTLLEPIGKPNRSNTVFVDSYIREAFATEYFPNQMTVVPKDGDKVKVTVEVQAPVNLAMGRPQQQAPAAPKFEKRTLVWHSYDSKRFNVKLFRFATGLDKDRYGVIFWTVTVINCEEDIENVRLAVGSNKAARWWVNGEELLRRFRSEKETPVIMLTSRTTETDEVLSMSYGADDYITKPYHPAILLLPPATLLGRTQTSEGD